MIKDRIRRSIEAKQELLNNHQLLETVHLQFKQIKRPCLQ
jgi:hypothetical protein